MDMNNKPVNVKVSSDDFGMLAFACAFIWLIAHGDPSIGESLRVIFQHLAEKP